MAVSIRQIRPLLIGAVSWVDDKEGRDRRRTSVVGDAPIVERV